MRDQITRLSDDSITLSPERRAALEQIAQEVSVQEVAHGSSRALLRPTLRSIILDALLRAESSQAQPLAAEPRPTHTAEGEEIVGWTAPQPSRPIVVAKCVYHGDHDDSQPLAAIDHAQDGSETP
jgi:hypothetical protein